MEDTLKNNVALKELYKAILNLKNEKECESFFRDLCTLSELTSFAERFDVAQKVEEGMSYRRINAETGVSTATITRVAHWLHHGMGGYKLVLERLKG